VNERQQHQAFFWGIIFALVIVFAWVLKPILLPFVAASVLAYFLDPAVERLSKRKVPRWLGTLLVLLGFVFGVILLVLLVAPLIQSQLLALVHALPGYVETVREKLTSVADVWMQKLSPEEVAQIKEAAGAYAGSAVGWAGTLFRSIVSKGFALFDVATLLVITPIVAFYLLRDWPKVTKNIDDLVPRAQHGLVRRALSDIDRTLSGFLRGQSLVCLSLATIYGVGLSLAGLKYGATIGIIAGVLSFIPYVGSGFVLVAGLTLAFIQFDDLTQIWYVVAVFLIGQALEGYVLTPKLVGDRVGLHPAWIIFALFAGGALMGFTGILIAVPVAAVLGVLIRIAIGSYKESPLYKKDKDKPKDKAKIEK